MAVSKYRGLAAAAAGLLLCASAFPQPRTSVRGPSPRAHAWGCQDTPSSRNPETQSPFLETGKKVFVERCSSCHNERGDKALSSGAPLSERSLTDEQLARAVAGRLKQSPQEEKRAVALYIRSFQKK